MHINTRRSIDFWVFQRHFKYQWTDKLWANTVWAANFIRIWIAILFCCEHQPHALIAGAKRSGRYRLCCNSLLSRWWMWDTALPRHLSDSHSSKPKSNPNGIHTSKHFSFSHLSISRFHLISLLLPLSHIYTSTSFTAFPTSTARW